MKTVRADLLLTFITLIYIEAGLSDYHRYLNDDNEYGTLGPPVVANSPVQSSQSNVAVYPRGTKGTGTSFADYMRNDDGWQPNLGRDRSEWSSQQTSFGVRSAPVVGSPRSQSDLAPSAQSSGGVGASFADYMKDDDDWHRHANRPYRQPSAPQSSFDVRSAPVVGSQASLSDFAPSPQGTRSSGIPFAGYMSDNDGRQPNVHAANTPPASTRNNFEVRNAPVVASQSSQSAFADGWQPSWPAPEQRSWSGSENDRSTSEPNWSNQPPSSYWDYLHSKEEIGRKERNKVHNSDASTPRCIPGDAVSPTICQSRNEDPMIHHGPFGMQRIVTSGAAWDK